MKSNVALFPFNKRMLPIVHHFDDFQNDFQLGSIISWRGSGLIGKDAAFVCNQPLIGHSVTDQFGATGNAWDTLIVDCESANNPNSTLNLNKCFLRCLRVGKRILFVGGNEKNLLQHYNSLYKDFSKQITLITADNTLTPPFWDNVKYTPVRVPVIMVGDLLGTEDTLEVILTLKKQFEKNGYAVSCVTNSNLGILAGMHSFKYVFDDLSLTEREKVLGLNRMVQNVIRVEHPDLVLLEAPDAMIKFSDATPNGFGIQTFMLSQAVSLDSLICCIPYSLVDEKFIYEINTDLMGKLGAEISAIHVSNTLIDGMTSAQSKELSYTYADMINVYEAISTDFCNLRIPVCNVIAQGGEALYHHLLTLFCEEQ